MSISNPEKVKEKVTSSGIPVKEVFTKVDLSSLNNSGKPGKFPYTRGIYKDMYRGKFWTMRQYAGFGNAEESNRRYHFLLAQGQTGLSVAFDLPTQMGYDSDHPMAEGEVGKAGVAICSLKDMETLFDGIPLDKVSVSMTINATAAILLSLYAALAKKKKIPLEKLSGTVQNDILKEYISRGTYIYPPKASLRLVTDLFKFTSPNIPSWHPISISGYHIREAGASAVQEVAFTLENGITYVKAGIEAGLKVDDFAPRLSFFFNAHNQFFEEVAKFRAARRMWAKIMQEKFKAKKEESLKLRFHTQTGGSTLTAQQVENNVVRVSLQALAAVLGGTQSLHTNSKDEALALPTQEAVQTALRTQQIIAYESGVPDTVDPLGGSYCVEYLTDKIEQDAMKYINHIEKNGGALWAIESGYYQKEIQKSAYTHQKKIEAGEEILVGVNKFQTEQVQEVPILKVDEKLVKSQIESLKELKKNRDNAKVQKVLEMLQTKAKSNENLIPFLIEAVENYATLGEISDALRKVWGEYKEKKLI